MEYGVLDGGTVERHGGGFWRVVSRPTSARKGFAETLS
jgi:hypothetical protein